PDPKIDYHILLGHPSDEYLKKFFQIHGITPLNPSQSARNCEICKKCKLKSSPHSNPLPTTDRPFKTLHMDVLQISPPSKSYMNYILVIINDYSRFNRIYMLKHKSKSESKILSYINEILNKTGKCPAIIHTDRGGEFNSKMFCSKLDTLGIRVEAGPANSPQTNGLAEQFNQTLLVKMRCLLAQFSVPINFWDEAAKYASTLINIIPSKALNWSTP
ncbi:putative retrotransposon protein, partial [Puccinia sorghi]